MNSLDLLKNYLKFSKLLLGKFYHLLKKRKKKDKIVKDWLSHTFNMCSE